MAQQREDERPSTRTAILYFLAAASMPVIGVILGLIQAFNANPAKKRLAGFSFAGAVAGTIAALGVYAALASR